MRFIPYYCYIYVKALFEENIFVSFVCFIFN